MGMYTGLRIKVTVKKEFVSMINKINNGENWESFSTEFPFIKNFSLKERSGFIPHGVLCYMPSYWENNCYKDGFNTTIDLKTGKWSFQCSLKNYDKEIEQFFNEVLCVIVSDTEHIEYLYELWDKSKFYKLINGKITEIKDEIKNEEK